MIPDIRNYLRGNHIIMDGDRKISKGAGKLLVTEVREKKNGYINPVIVTFQNGELNDGSDFKVSLKANQFGQTKVEVETSYGHVFKDANSTEKPQQKQIILVRNRKTNKVKIVEVDNAVLINSALITPHSIEPTEINFAKEVKNLNKQFGGKKIVTRLEQREKLNLSSLPITDEVKKAVEDIKVEENVSLNDTEVESIIDLLPPCHRDATSLMNVYVMNEILSEEELQALKDEVDSFEEKKFNSQEYSPFFMDCYVEAKKSKENLKARLAGVLFVECLIKFLKMQSKKLATKRVILCSFSTVIHDKLLNEFCVKTETSVTRPLTMRDKALCYIIAVSLISCDYKINLKLLATTVSMHLSRLSRLARAVGAVPIPKQENIFILKLPLPALPKASGGRAKKK